MAGSFVNFVQDFSSRCSVQPSLAPWGSRHVHDQNKTGINHAQVKHLLKVTCWSFQSPICLVVLPKEISKKTYFAIFSSRFPHGQTTLCPTPVLIKTEPSEKLFSSFDFYILYPGSDLKISNVSFVDNEVSNTDRSLVTSWCAKLLIKGCCY